VKPFAGNDEPTIGIEEEFHLIDPQTADLKSGVEELRRRLDDDMQARVCYEMFQCVIENRTGVFRRVDDLVASSLEGRRKLDEAAWSAEMRVVSAACHPFADWRGLPIAADQHYRNVVADYGYPARRLLSFGLHVHVGVRSAETALYVMRRMRPWIYALLAMSANSPFFEGLATGLKSARMHLFGSMPRTFLPPRFETWDELVTHYEAMIAAGDVTRPGELWWNLRPQPPLGTVELRVLDLPTDVHRTGALVAVFQAAVATFQDAFDAGEPIPETSEAYLDQNRWRAMRDGMDAVFVDPVDGEVLPVRDYLAHLMDAIEPVAEELGSRRHFDLARHIIDTRSEAAWQIDRAAELNGDLRALELEIADRTVRDDLSEM